MSNNSITREELAQGLTPDTDDIDSIMFFHGKESGPYGSKFVSLNREFTVDSPDFQGMDIWERLETADNLTTGMKDLVVVGSSYGGLLAALLYSRRPERFKGYVLLAPALYDAHDDAVSTIERVPENAVVIHGTEDAIVPIESVRKFCDRFGVEMVEVSDGHRLRDHHDIMLAKVREVNS